MFVPIKFKKLKYMNGYQPRTNGIFFLLKSIDKSKIDYILQVTLGFE
jgi:hypothetical protein